MYRLAGRRDEAHFGAVGDGHVQQLATGLFHQPVTVAGGVWIDSLDGSESLAAMAADQLRRVGVVARGQDDANLGAQRSWLAMKLCHNALDPALLHQQADDRCTCADLTAQPDQRCLQGCNVSPCAWHQIVHSRRPVGRLRAWPHEGQAHALQPGQRLCRVPEKEAAQVSVVLRLVGRRRKLARILGVRLQRIGNARGALQAGAVGRVGADCDGGGAAQLRLLLQQQDAQALLSRADGRSQPAAAAAHDDHIVSRGAAGRCGMRGHAGFRPSPPRS